MVTRAFFRVAADPFFTPDNVKDAKLPKFQPVPSGETVDNRVQKLLDDGANPPRRLLNFASHPLNEFFLGYRALSGLFYHLSLLLNLNKIARFFSLRQTGSRPAEHSLQQ